MMLLVYPLPHQVCIEYQALLLAYQVLLNDHFQKFAGGPEMFDGH